MKNRWIHLRVSEKERQVFKRAAESMSKLTGQKENVSRTILTAVQKFAEQDVSFENSKN
jgi:hypothetical protein